MAQVNIRADATSRRYLIEMIKAVRQRTGWGLKDAKDAVDRCLAGEVLSIQVKTPADAAKFAHEVRNCRFLAEVVGGDVTA